MNPIPFSSFESFSRLFKDYTEDFEKLAPFFNGDYRSDEDLIRACERAAAKHPNRSQLAEILTRQAANFDIAESSAKLVEKISNPSSVAVVTGQQLGLFGGPLYTLFKSVTAIQLAARLEQLTGQPAVPVFWLEGEDHDFQEIASAGFLSGDEAKKVVYNPASPASPADGDSAMTAVGRHMLTPEITAAVEDVENLLQPTDFRDELISLLRSAYASENSMLKAFVTVMDAIIGPGRILFLSPDDPGLKSMASPLFAKEIEDFSTSSSLLESVNADLEKDYHVQVRTNPTNLFLHTDAGRMAIDMGNEEFQTRDGQGVSRDRLMERLKESPQDFSPNVVMRPLMQDTVLPTAAYVAGPGEVAYFAQFKALYEWADIPMPIIYPRASATLLEKRVGKILERQDLSIPDFEEQLERLFGRVVLDHMEVDLDSEFKSASASLHKAVNEIKPVIEKIDRSLVKSADATRAAFMKEWSRLQSRVEKAEKLQHDVVRTQLNRASTSLFPFGILQERVLSPLYFLNKYGPDLGQTLIQHLDLNTTAHQVIEI